MNGGEFIKRIKKLGKRNKIEIRIISSRGKGSHVTLYYGDKFTIVKDRKKELGAGLYAAMMKQLGL